MNYAIAGDAIVARPKFDPIKSVMHARHNILTGADFNPPPKKSLLDKLIEFLVQQGKP